MLAIDSVSLLHKTGMHDVPRFILESMTPLISEDNRAEEVFNFIVGLIEKDILIGSHTYAMMLKCLYEH